MKIRKWNYGNYSSDNYGSHTQAFTDNYGNDYYFSYNTLVAVHTNEGEEFIRENVWGSTTGKHLNWINPDHSIRLSSSEFETAISKLNLQLEVA
tara:strand:- start:804 stop:1085 length:282 start_codon:yes stop_codon:yes gene_type:complete